jgi:2-polyprenyl-3-methyl-5-hydroxy-6-metoxy-1,4-benzoquinol methylase
MIGLWWHGRFYRPKAALRLDKNLFINDFIMTQLSVADWIDARINRCCPLCSGRQSSIISSRMQFGLNLNTVICNNCSFVFTNPLPLPMTYNKFYNEAYSQYYGHISRKPWGRNLEVEPHRVTQRLDQINLVEPLKGARLLEIGPGQGLFLYWAHRRGSLVLGIEPSITFYKAINDIGLPCLHGLFEEFQLNGKLYDIIYMNHVLEHFYDPDVALIHCKSILRENGKLAVAVPNILKPFRSLDRYFLRYVHPSSFSPQTLRAMLEKHGFDVIMMDEGGSDWSQPQDLFMISRRLKSVHDSSFQPTQTAEEVMGFLRSYRINWIIWGAALWHIDMAFKKSFRLSKRIARRLMRIFN